MSVIGVFNFIVTDMSFITADGRLHSLDVEYDDKKMDDHGIWLISVEERVLNFQKQLEERSRSDMKLEV